MIEYAMVLRLKGKLWSLLGSELKSLPLNSYISMSIVVFLTSAYLLRLLKL